MPQLNFAVPQSLLDRVDSQKPDFLDRKSFLCLLIAQSLDGVDKGCTVGGPSAAGTPSSSIEVDTLTLIDTSIKEEYKVQKPKNAAKTRAKTRAKRTQGTPEFEAFWKVYQSCPSKANCQSKAAAWEAWEQVIAWEAPQRLLEAAQKAVDQCHDLQRRGEFCAPLPDCFRWLRDERYAVLLEDHAPAVAIREGDWI